MRFIAILLLFTATSLRAEVIDLTSHTSLKGAFLVPQPHAEFVTAQLLLNVGEADHVGPEGLAHYLEHLVWYSADKAHDGLSKDRVANAWTNILFTNYWNASEASKLGDMLAASARVFAPIDLEPAFSKSERDIVVREFDLRKVDNPSGQLYNRMRKTLIPGHALARSVIGSRESLGEITPQMATSFKDKWYLPGNATLLISGPVTAAAVIPKLEEYLIDLPAGNGLDHPWLSPIKWDGRNVRTTLQHSKISEAFFSIHIKAPVPSKMKSEQANRATDLLSELLNSSTLGSPRKALYYDDFVLNSIDVSVWVDRADTINLWVTATPDLGVEIEEAIEATWKYFQTLSSFPQQSFEQVYQDKIDTYLRKKRYASVEERVAFEGLLERGVPFSSNEYLEDMKAVTLPMLDRLISTLQSDGISVIGLAYPKDTK